VYAQVVEKKDLEPIRDERLLKRGMEKIMLTKKALNKISEDMGMIDLSLR
jgi:hypothetical protein